MIFAITYSETLQKSLEQRVLYLEEMAKLQILTSAWHHSAEHDQLRQIPQKTIQEGFSNPENMQLIEQIKTSQSLTQCFSWEATELHNYTYLKQIISALPENPEELDFVLKSLEATEKIAGCWSQHVYNTLFQQQRDKQAKSNLDLQLNCM